MNRKRTRWTCYALIATMAILASVCITLAAEAESKNKKIARAMRAAPPSISQKATIVDVDWTVLRPGSNGWQCRPGSAPSDMHPECDDKVWVRLMKALDSKADFKTDHLGIAYMLQGEPNTNNADPFDTDPSP